MENKDTILEPVEMFDKINEAMAKLTTISQLAGEKDFGLYLILRDVNDNLDRVKQGITAHLSA